MGKTEGSLYEAVCKSLDCATRSGRVDAKAHAAAICAVKKLARQVDADPERAVNVTFPTMLKFLDALGLLPDRNEPAAQAPKQQAGLVKFDKYRRTG